MAFLSLYGEHICSMNQLVITNEEDVEYCAFECMIATHDAFCLSKVMSCTFRPVWTPKRKIIELTDAGKLWGEYFFSI